MCGKPTQQVKKSFFSKNRIGVSLLAAGAIVSSAALGAAVASVGVDSPSSSSPDYKLASHTVAIEQLPSFPTTPLSPQILNIKDFKPIADLSDQVNKAIAYHTEQVAKDIQSRKPLPQVPEVPLATTVKPAQGVLTSGFGSRWGAIHRGVDIANKLGTPIVAAEDGVVISAGPASGFGQWVRLRHSDGTITVYGHMETIDVAVGQHVKAGQKIAGMGSRGYSTGVHLHFEVHPTGGAAIDPIPWLAARGISL